MQENVTRENIFKDIPHGNEEEVVVSVEQTLPYLLSANLCSATNLGAESTLCLSPPCCSFLDSSFLSILSVFHREKERCTVQMEEATYFKTGV